MSVGFELGKARHAPTLLGVLKTISLMLSVLLLSVTTISTAHAALSATTANTIQGRAPELILKGPSIGSLQHDLVTVVMPDGITLLFPSANSADGQGSVTVNNKLNEFQPYMEYQDQDGDLGSSLNTQFPGISGITFIWKDKYGNVINSLADNFSGCLAPYKLEVKAVFTKAVSEYGDPRVTNIYNNGTVRSRIYTIKVAGDDRICNYQTLSSYDAGGINAIYYKSGEGFNHDAIKNAGKRFPSTGFAGAVYKLVMTNDQKDYHYKVDIGGTTVADTSTNLQATTGVTVNSAGEVKLLSRPSGIVTVTATHKVTGTTDSHSFTISKWGTPGSSLVLASSAATSCGGESGLFKYSEVTSGSLPSTPATNAASSYGGNVIRDLGRLGDEWGNLTDYGLTVRYWFDNSKTVTVWSGGSGVNYYYRLILLGTQLAYSVYDSENGYGSSHYQKAYAFCKS